MFYIHQRKAWPHFTWGSDELLIHLGAVRHSIGKLTGQMTSLGFVLQKEAELETLTLDVVKTNEIEGAFLDPEQVRSSVAKRLGLNIPGMIPVDRHIDGVVEMMMDATQKFDVPLSMGRLFDWHAALFPTGRSGMHKIITGAWRDDSKGPMQVVSGSIGRELVHFQAPDAAVLDQEMEVFLSWFNENQGLDPVLKAAIAHLWFVTIHPFEDGNGRIARAVADMQLARADDSSQRFYSMSAQIGLERNSYYNILERTQKGDLDITEWLVWFLDCLKRALLATETTLQKVLKKASFWDEHRKTIMNERQRLMVNKLLDGFDGNLITSKWAKITKCSTDTALRDIQDLIDKNVLRKLEEGGRSTRYDLIKP
ncbi:MAG: Fic family protein [Saprospiraceae bacterium]|nr:Fic family protein [Saprospiraceae bacterium]